jgi:hypothetical protein
MNWSPGAATALPWQVSQVARVTRPLSSKAVSWPEPQ